MSDSDLRPGERYFLRGCLPGGVAYGGFVWPLAVGAVVTAPDWTPDRVCGGGLHGNLDGGGDPGVLVSEGMGMVVAADESTAVGLGGKWKFPTCRILYVGESLRDAATWLAARVGTPVHYGTATAGHLGTATAGNCGTATAGHLGTATAGQYGTATAGDGGTATAGQYGTATAGHRGTATAGSRGTATAGHYGTATVGDHGTATAGGGGTATAGDGGIATAGEGGLMVIKHLDGTWKVRPGDGRTYRLTDAGDFEEVAK